MQSAPSRLEPLCVFGRPSMRKTPRGPLFATMAAAPQPMRGLAIPCAAAEQTLAKPARPQLTAAHLALVSKRTD